jgi:hypothetical protein
MIRRQSALHCQRVEDNAFHHVREAVSHYPDLCFDIRIMQGVKAQE